MVPQCGVSKCVAFKLCQHAWETHYPAPLLTTTIKLLNTPSIPNKFHLINFKALEVEIYWVDKEVSA